MAAGASLRPLVVVHDLGHCGGYTSRHGTYRSSAIGGAQVVVGGLLVPSGGHHGCHGGAPLDGVVDYRFAMRLQVGNLAVHLRHPVLHGQGDVARRERSGVAIAQHLRQPFVTGDDDKSVLLAAVEDVEVAVLGSVGKPQRQRARCRGPGRLLGKKLCSRLTGCRFAHPLGLHSADRGQGDG